MRRRDNLRGIMIYATFVLVALFLIVTTVACYYGCVVDSRRQDAIDGGVIAEAEIVSIRFHSVTRGYSQSSCDLTYEYTDATGIKYWGIAESGINNQKYAESQIGKKVNIYIDGRGNSIVVGRKPHIEANVIASIIFTILSIAAVAFDIWFIFFQGKKSKKKEQAKETVATQKVVPKGATAKKKR